MGPTRYHYSALKQLIVPNFYRCRVRVWCTEGMPKKRTVCLQNCQVCAAADPSTIYSNSLSATAALRHQRIRARSLGRLVVARKNFREVDISQEGSVFEPSTLVNPPEASKPVQWKEYEGEFLCVNAAILSCRNNVTPYGASPFAHLGDGYLDLFLLEKCSQVRFLRHLSLLMGYSPAESSFHQNSEEEEVNSHEDEDEDLKLSHNSKHGRNRSHSLTNLATSWGHPTRSFSSLKLKNQFSKSMHTITRKKHKDHKEGEKDKVKVNVDSIGKENEIEELKEGEREKTEEEEKTITGDRTDPFGFRFIHTFKTREFEVLALDEGHQSSWNVDGELLVARRLRVTVLRRLASLFVPGIVSH
eukprot:TRINITY_DN2699_c0_g1_i3.p2 TRINITY_DN2699_c0_g1~~TRINITY_DN2699_c0_g1_i3.p2  ORF type:complete len:359 (-),score=55.46 TRINITY_DN2699_c0_g1_i3:21-1097(-)